MGGSSADAHELIVREYWALGPAVLAEELGGKWTAGGVMKCARHLGVDIPGWPGYIRLRVAARVIGGEFHAKAAARAIWRLARRDGVLIRAGRGAPLVPVPWVWEVEPEVLEGVFRYGPWGGLDAVPMGDEEVRFLITRYLRRTGDWGGAEALWEAHLSWRRANGLPPAGGVARARSGGGGGVLRDHGHLGGRGARRG